MVGSKFSIYFMSPFAHATRSAIFHNTDSFFQLHTHIHFSNRIQTIMITYEALVRLFCTFLTVPEPRLTSKDGKVIAAYYCWAHAVSNRSRIRDQHFSIYPITASMYLSNLSSCDEMEGLLFDIITITSHKHQSAEKCMHGQVVDMLGIHDAAAQPPTYQCTKQSQQYHKKTGLSLIV